MAYSNRTPLNSFSTHLMENLQIEHWICDTKIHIRIFGESEYKKRFPVLIISSNRSST